MYGNFSSDYGKTTLWEKGAPDIVYCFEDQDVQEAAQRMEKNQIRRLIVLNRDKRLVGIVSSGTDGPPRSMASAPSHYDRGEQARYAQAKARRDARGAFAFVSYGSFLPGESERLRLRLGLA